MKNVGFAISSVTGAFLIFVVLCSPIISVPLAFLTIFLLALQVGLIWMVYTILKYGKPSSSTFDEKWYDDFPDGKK